MIYWMHQSIYIEKGINSTGEPSTMQTILKLRCHLQELWRGNEGRNKLTSPPANDIIIILGLTSTVCVRMEETMTRKRLYTELFNRYNRERRQFFLDARDESARQNLRMLKKISIFLLPFLLLAFCIAPVIIEGWAISLPYFLLAGVIVVFALFSVAYSNRPEINAWIANMSCVAFIIIIFAMLFWIDIFLDADRPASFVPLVLVMVQGIFILRFRVVVPLMAAVEALYIFLVLQFKNIRIGENDIFTSIIGLAFGYLLSLTIVQLRIQDNNAKREYQRRSMVDPVTGILNKFSIENSVRDTLAARDPAANCALLRIDIDNMKRMNDELGTLVGDMFLENVAEFLTSIFRGSDTIGRIGGDEFMVFVRDMKGEDWLAGKCSRIQHEVKALSNENGNINMTCSIGAAVSGEQEVSFEQMYTLADDCLYKAKTRGRGKYVMHHVHTEKEVIQ